MGGLDITGRRALPASRARAWAHLTSPESLASCIPGCTDVSGSVARGFDMVVIRKLGPVKLNFAGTISLSDIDPARSVTLTGRGRGGVAGLAEGRARIQFSDHPAGCEIAWDLGALVEGRISRFGARPIRAAAAMMTETFVDRLEGLLRREAGQSG